MCITEHLSTLKRICHVLAHSTSLLISSCSSIMSSGFLALWQSLVSSANLDIFLTVLVSRSFIYMINSSWPNTLPCGTPDLWLVTSYYRIGWTSFVLRNMQRNMQYDVPIMFKTCTENVSYLICIQHAMNYDVSKIFTTCNEDMTYLTCLRSQCTLFYLLWI